MDSTPKRISRRVLLKMTFAAGLGAGLLGSLGIVASFLYPSARKNPARLVLGGIGSFPVGSKTFFNVYEDQNGIDAVLMRPDSTTDKRPGVARTGIWLVRLEHGFLALSSKCTHLGATVPWRPDFAFRDPSTGSEKRGWFRCPSHGATFTEAGVRVYGPAPRSMDRYDVEVAGGKVMMNFTALRQGTPDNAKFAVDPDAPI
jgi:Rieske Fe-S protein